MPRHRQHRRVTAAPTATFFKPQGTFLRETETVVMPVEGLEALRLADLEGLCAEAAAEAMGVSRHTFGRVLAEARRATATALVGGLALRIEGGSYRLVGEGPLNPENERMGPAGCGVDGPSAEDTDMQGQGQGGRCGRGLGGNPGGPGQGGPGRGRGQGQGRGVGRGRGQTPPASATQEAASGGESGAAKALERHCQACGAASTGAFCPGCGAAMGA